MSETTKKRCRKSKLVPRECADMDFEKIEEMQDPKPKLPKIKMERDPVPSTAPLAEVKLENNFPMAVPAPIQFSIKIEVEEYNESDKNNSDDKEIHEKNLKRITVDEDELHKYLDKALKLPANTPDKIIESEIKKTFIKHFKSEESYQDELLSNAVEKWRLWKIPSKNRLEPTTYKCYICLKAWWRYGEFRDHIQSHFEYEFKISLEIVAQEANLVAHILRFPNTLDIPIEGNCMKCGEDFYMHTHIYTCQSCQKGGLTNCIELKLHQGTCESYRVAYFKERNLPYSRDSFPCTICPMKFLSQSDLDNHLMNYHVVKSDEPTSVRIMKCMECHIKYPIYDKSTKHACTIKFVHTCDFCLRSFYTKGKLVMHMGVNYEPMIHTCMICMKIIDKKCMEAQHMLTHSEKYSLVFRCLGCEEYVLFLDQESVELHIDVVHKFKSIRSDVKYYTSMILPKAYIIDKLILQMNEENTVDRTTRSPDDNQPLMIMDTSKTGEPTVSEDPEEAPEYKIEIKEEPIDVFENVVIKQEVSDNEDNEIYTQMLSNVFQTSKDISGTSFTNDLDEEIKLEITETQEEELYEDDIIVLNQSCNSELPTLEPEIILESGHKLKRMYECRKCGYKNYHREFKEHVEFVCPRAKRINSMDKKKFPTDQNSCYECTKCQNTYSSFNTYLQHFCSVHNVGATTCPQCLAAFPSLSYLTRHVNMHIKSLIIKVTSIDDNLSQCNNKFQCVRCQMVIVVGSLFQHWESHLELKETYANLDMSGPIKKQEISQTKVRKKATVVIKKRKDDQVGFQESRQISLLLCNQKEAPKPIEPAIEDNDLHLSPELKMEAIALLGVVKQPGVLRVKDCNICGRHFERQNECKRHIIEHLLTDAYRNKQVYGCLQCQICHEGFEKADKYKHHMRNHASLPVYQCAICDKKFSDSSNFAKHKKVHNLMVFICDICNKKFQAKNSLIKHIATHDSSQPIICECKRRFFCESTFKKHYKQHHDKSIKRFRCAICKMKFLSLKDKWDHLWEVHKERKNKADCPVCDKSFRKLQDVRTHIKVDHRMDITILNNRQHSHTHQQAADIEEFLINTPQIEFGNENGETLIVYE